ncbi:MAG: T9SS type A sorting domain-containing protein, partial [Cryomorphaceae bacterium]
TSVDVQSLNNGELRRNLNYENWQSTIESIGPHNGIQHGGVDYLSGFGTILGCATENGEVLWSAVGGCSGILSTSEAEGKNSLSLFPNPATKEIWLELEDSRGTYTYQVLDVSGKSRAEGQIIQANQSLDISKLPTGVYTIQLSNDQGISAAKKFVKTSD